MSLGQRAIKVVGQTVPILSLLPPTFLCVCLWVNWWCWCWWWQFIEHRYIHAATAYSLLLNDCKSSSWFLLLLVVYAWYVCVAIGLIHLTLTRTTGSLSLAQMLMRVIAHRGVQTTKERVHWKLTPGRKSLAAPGLTIDTWICFFAAGFPLEAWNQFQGLTARTPVSPSLFPFFKLGFGSQLSVSRQVCNSGGSAWGLVYCLCRFNSQV